MSDEEDAMVGPDDVAALYEQRQLHLRAELLVMIMDWQKYANTFPDDLLPPEEIIIQMSDQIDKLLYQTE